MALIYLYSIICRQKRQICCIFYVEITPGMVQPIIYRGPGGAPVVGLQLAPVAIRPPGLLPPGPPPGLPPALRVHRLPTGQSLLIYYVIVSCQLYIV